MQVDPHTSRPHPVAYLSRGLQKGERGVYISMEESPREIKEDVSRFGWDFEKLQYLSNLLSLRELATFSATIVEESIICIGVSLDEYSQS